MSMTPEGRAIQVLADYGCDVPRLKELGRLIRDAITEAEADAQKEVSDKIYAVIVDLYGWPPVLARAVGFMEQPPAESDDGQSGEAAPEVPEPWTEPGGRVMARRTRWRPRVPDPRRRCMICGRPVYVGYRAINQGTCHVRCLQRKMAPRSD